MKFDFLPKLRSYLIIMAIPVAMVLIATKSYACEELSEYIPLHGENKCFLDAQECRRIEFEKLSEAEMKRFEEQLHANEREHEERLKSLKELIYE